MIKQPIIVAAPARSGTTMIAGLLVKHGVWIGNAKVTKHPQTNVSFGTENIELKNVMKSIAKEIGYRNRQTPLPRVDEVKEKAARLRKEAERIVPKDTTWLVKTSWTLILSEIWQEAFPDARWVFVEREPRMIMNSMKRHPQMSRHVRNRRQISRFIQLLHLRQARIATTLNNNQYLFVHAGLVVAKDIEVCERLLAFCGLKLNEKVLDNWIEPERWHNTYRK